LDLGLCVAEISNENPPSQRTMELGEPEVLSVTPLEAAILDQALQCERGRPSLRLPYHVLLELLRIEEDFPLPDSMRGIILATGCLESGLQSGAEGDHKFSRKGKPKAIGFVQMWPWWEGRYGIDRKNPHQSVRAYLSFMSEQMEVAKQICGYSDEKAWVVGQARAARGSISKGYRRQLRKLPKKRQAEIETKYGVDLAHISSNRALQIGRKELDRKSMMLAERCFDETRHYQRLRRWRKAWQAQLWQLARLESRRTDAMQ